MHTSKLSIDNKVGVFYKFGLQMFGFYQLYPSLTNLTLLHLRSYNFFNYALSKDLNLFSECQSSINMLVMIVSDRSGSRV